MPSQYPLMCPSVNTCVDLRWATLHSHKLPDPTHPPSLPPSLVPLLLYPLTISQDERTALMYAAQEGKDECVKVLLEAGCDKEAKDKVRDERGVVVMPREIVVLSCNG